MSERRGAGAASRAPVWSQYLTRPLSRAIPTGMQPATLTAIKVIHTAIFMSIGGLIGLLLWDGMRGRPGRRAAAAMSVAIAESVVYVSNNQVCPLTPLAEELGAERGSVADIFLPGWLSRRIPVIASSALLMGIALNLRALARRSRV